MQTAVVTMNRLIYAVLIGMLLSITYAIYTLPPLVEAREPKYFIMTSTAYSRHPNCIAPKWDDGLTATGTPIREGVVAINVDRIDGRWQVRSPLKLGQKIYIEGIGDFSVEDTGPFTEKNFHFDIWNLDIYKKDYKQAKEWGIKRIKVYVLGE
jgi:3D (Asp-Asp-Asp) domain-containing protein